MGRVFEAVIDFLNADGWRFEEVTGQTAVRFGFTGRNARFECYGRVNEDHETFVFFSILPLRAPEEKRASLAELITRINYGMNIGNFEMDMNDGELRYKTSIDVEGGDLTQKMVETLVTVNLSTTDRYFTAFTDVLYANVSPAEAVGRVEVPEPSARN